MAEPFIKLYKKMLKWEWYDDVNTFRLFLHCLLRANWESGSWHGIHYEPGQFITSLQTLSDETRLTVKQVRTALDHLKVTNEVADLRQGNYRIITVVKWNEYQCKGKPNGKLGADQGQTEGKLGATDKEYKEYKEQEEEKEVKNISPYNPPKEKQTYYPNDEKLNQAFVDYVAMRKQIKSPMTDRAVELAISKLEKLSGGDNDKAIAILEQSVMNSWKGLFELREIHDKPQQSLAEKWGLT